MTKEVLLVFQDCYDCGSSADWYNKQKEKAEKAKIKIIPTPFTAPGAKKLILDAEAKGFKKMPFLTDGSDNFGYNIANFASKPTKPKKKKVKLKDEAVSEK